MPAKSIFLVEDDAIIRANFSELLGDAGFDVTGFEGRAGVIEAVAHQPPDLLLIDIALGTERDGGFDLCAALRPRWPQLPIVFLSSRDSDLDKVSGLRLGADDYITKDTSFDYLLVRIETLLKRVEVLRASAADTPDENARPDGHLQLDNQRCEARWQGQKLPLTLTQFWILQALAGSPGAVKRPGELMQAAKIVVEPNTIVAHVKAIRGAFSRIDPEFSNIRTERGKGYRWLD